MKRKCVWFLWFRTHHHWHFKYFFSVYIHSGRVIRSSLQTNLNTMGLTGDTRQVKKKITITIKCFSSFIKLEWRACDLVFCIITTCILTYLINLILQNWWIYNLFEPSNWINKSPPLPPFVLPPCLFFVIFMSLLTHYLWIELNISAI